MTETDESAFSDSDDDDIEPRERYALRQLRFKRDTYHADSVRYASVLFFDCLSRLKSRAEDEMDDETTDEAESSKKSECCEKSYEADFVKQKYMGHRNARYTFSSFAVGYGNSLRSFSFFW